MPVAVGDLLERRLDRLSESARRVLAVGAVIGVEFDAEVLAAAADQDEDVVLDALDEGTAASVIRAAERRGDTRYRFAHALLSEALRRSFNPLRLRRTSERVADALARLAPDSPAEIARHYDAAARPEPAHRYAFLAGERAASVYAHDVAATFF